MAAVRRPKFGLDRRFFSKRQVMPGCAAGRRGNVSMVNIHIPPISARGGAVFAAAALEQFQQQWATYQKLVDADELSHTQRNGRRSTIT